MLLRRTAYDAAGGEPNRLRSVRATFWAACVRVRAAADFPSARQEKKRNTTPRRSAPRCVSSLRRWHDLLPLHRSSVGGLLRQLEGDPDHLLARRHSPVGVGRGGRTGLLSPPLLRLSPATATRGAHDQMNLCCAPAHRTMALAMLLSSRIAAESKPSAAAHRWHNTISRGSVSRADMRNARPAGAARAPRRCPRRGPPRG